MLSQWLEAEENAVDEMFSFSMWEEGQFIGDYRQMSSSDENNIKTEQPDPAEITVLLNKRLGKIPHFLMVISQDTRIVFANDIARKTLHAGSLENIVGKSLLQFTSQNLDKYITKCFREKLSGVRLCVENAFPRAQSGLNELLAYYEYFSGTGLLLLVSINK